MIDTGAMPALSPARRIALHRRRSNPPNDFAGALGSRPHPADGGMGHRPSWRSSFVSDHGNPQLGDTPAGTAGPFKADELGPSRFKADIEAFDLAEPAVELRLDDAVGEASDDLDQASPLCGVYAEHRASDTCVLVLTRLSEFC